MSSSGPVIAPVNPAATRWVALLRGVNVGGANTIAMAGLRATFCSLDLRDVVTYIQSGNVVFDVGTGRAAHLDEGALVDVITTAIAARHRLTVPVVLRTVDQMASAARRHPDADGSIDPKLLPVLFLSAVPSPDAITTVNPSAYHPDRVVLDGREIFVTYPDGSARSKLAIDVLERALRVTITARNLNTVRKLVKLGQPG